MDDLTFSYSQLSAESVSTLVNLHYGFDSISHSALYALGLHDNYLVINDGIKYILRIYRSEWRNQDEVLFELSLLDFLGTHHAAVATPLQTTENQLFFSVNCPEGNRLATLFSYADGKAPGRTLSEDESHLLGKTVAEMHQLSDSFQTDYSRKELDIPYLLDESMLAINHYLDNDKKKYIHKLQQLIKQQLPYLPRAPHLFGICAGDINANNFHINEQHAITLFDFDQCGFGFRAFEIAKFNASLQSLNNKTVLANAFLKGYQQVRPLTQDELHAIPCFEIISVIWVMAIHVYNKNLIGSSMLGNTFWDRRIEQLKQLESDLVIQ